MTAKKQEEKKDSSNKIVLPPPLDEVEVYSPVLLMKVASEDENDINDQFFLDYSKKQYLDLLQRGGEKRTEKDIKSEEDDSSSDRIEESEYNTDEEDANSDVRVYGDDEDDDDEEDFMIEDYEDMELDEDGEKIGMLNLCMGQILRQFNEQNGHGPDTRQLLEMRLALADKLGVEVLPLEHSFHPTNDGDESEDHTSLKRISENSLEDGNNDSQTKKKRVKFSSCLEEEHIFLSDSVEEGQEMLSESIEEDEEILSSSVESLNEQEVVA